MRHLLFLITAIAAMAGGILGSLVFPRKEASLKK